MLLALGTMARFIRAGAMAEIRLTADSQMRRPAPMPTGYDFLSAISTLGYR
jgi:hypothetical protein